MLRIIKRTLKENKTLTMVFRNIGFINFNTRPNA